MQKSLFFDLEWQARQGDAEEFHGKDIESVGWRSFTIVRPSLIGGERDESRFSETIALGLMSFFAPVLPKKFRVNPASVIAEAILDAALRAEPGHHLRNAESLVG